MAIMFPSPMGGALIVKTGGTMCMHDPEINIPIYKIFPLLKMIYI